MESLNVIAKWIENYNEEVFKSMEYKIACDFNREDLQFDGTQEQFEDLKDKAFYMACEIVNIKYELGKMNDFLKAIQKYK